MKKYTDFQLGFDRTQLFKEHEAPIIQRMSAMRAAQSFFESNQVPYTMYELMKFTKGIMRFFQDGDEQVFSLMDKYLEKKLKKSLVE